MIKFPEIGLATRNRHKVEEVQAILRAHGWHGKLLDGETYPYQEPGETGESFLENARIKAKAYGQYFRCPTLADDSGLVIPQLGGFPGIYSSRWGEGRFSQHEKNIILCEIMKVYPENKRTAYFVCAIAFYDPSRDTFLWEHEARVEGRIVEYPRGEGGFGYDPIFLVPSLNKTFAEIPQKMKNEMSHRGKALKAWIDWITGYESSEQMG